MDNNTKFCSTCGKQIPADAQFCTVCGAPQTTDQSVETAPEESAPAAEAAPAAENAEGVKAFDKKLLTKILSPLIVAAIALIMLITAFLPVVKVNAGTDEDAPVYKVSALNTVTFMFDSFKSMSSEDIRDSKLYEKFEEQYENFYDEMKDLGAEDYDSYKELPGKIKNLYNKIFVTSTRMSLQSENYKTNLSLVVAGLAALLYVVATVAFFAFAVMNLLKAVSANEEEEKKEAFDQKKLNKLFLAIPMVLALAFFSGKMAFTTFGISERLMSLSGAAVFTFIVVFLAFAASLALEILFDVKKFVSVAKEKLVKLIGVAASLLLSVVILITLSSPVLSASVSAKFGGRSGEKKMNIPLETSYFASLRMTESEKEYAESKFDTEDEAKEIAVKSLFGGFASYSVKDVKEGEANSKNASFVSNVSSYAGIYKLNFIYGLVAVLYIVAFALAAHGVWCGLVALLNGEKESVSFAKVNVAVVAVAVIAALVFAISVNGAVKDFGVKDYSLGLSFGAILTLLLALVAAVSDKLVAFVKVKAAHAGEAPVAAPAEETPAEETPAEETPVSETSSEEENA